MLKNATGQDRTYAAIGMFAGVRPEEICRVSWAMVDLDHSRIRIPGSITKTRIGRTIDLEPNAVAWLSSVPKRRGRSLMVTLLV
jgi:integrase